MTQARAFQIADTFVALDDASGARPLPVTDDFWPALIGGRLAGSGIRQEKSSSVCSKAAWNSFWRSTVSTSA